MKLPTETLVDCLRCLDRPNLDAVQISTKRLRNAVAKLRDVCLRLLQTAVLGAAYEGKELLPGAYRICTRPEHRKLAIETVWTEEDAGECFANLIASSCIEHILIDWVMRLTDRVLQLLQPVLPSVRVGHLLIRADLAPVSPGVFVETLTAFGSIDILRFAAAKNVQPGHISDALVNYAADKGTRQVYLPEAGELECNITDESILNFLKAPGRGLKTRRLVVWRPRLSPQFLERLVEAHLSGLIVSDVEMELFEINIPHPDVNGPLRFSVAKIRNGNVISFDNSIKLSTKYGYQSVEYESCKAVLRRKSKKGKSRQALPALPVCQKPFQLSSYKK